MTLRDGIEIAGGLCLIAAAGLLHIAAGLAVAGVLLVLIANSDQLRGTGDGNRDVDGRERIPPLTDEDIRRQPGDRGDEFTVAP